MTAISIGANHAPASGPRRLLNVARLQAVSPMGVAWPWIILAISFFVNLALFASLHAKDIDGGSTGGVSSIYIVMTIVYYNAVTRDFPFALSMGVTRRTFYLATVAFAVAQALAYGAVLGLFRIVEVATDGWGIELAFFGPSYTQVGNPLLQWLVYSGPFLLTGAIGLGLGVVVKRWGANGVMTLVAATIGVLGLAATMATLLEWWDAIGEWWTSSSAAALLAGWPAAAAGVVALAAYLTLRRATP
jgi:hypothetical protein